MRLAQTLDDADHAQRVDHEEEDCRLLKAHADSLREKAALQHRLQAPTDEEHQRRPEDRQHRRYQKGIDGVAEPGRRIRRCQLAQLAKQAPEAPLGDPQRDQQEDDQPVEDRHATHVRPQGLDQRKPVAARDEPLQRPPRARDVLHAHRGVASEPQDVAADEVAEIAHGPYQRAVGGLQIVHRDKVGVVVVDKLVQRRASLLEHLAQARLIAAPLGAGRAARQLRHELPHLGVEVRQAVALVLKLEELELRAGELALARPEPARSWRRSGRLVRCLRRIRPMAWVTPAPSTRVWSAWKFCEMRASCSRRWRRSRAAPSIDAAMPLAPVRISVRSTFCWMAAWTTSGSEAASSAILRARSSAASASALRRASTTPCQAWASRVATSTWRASWSRCAFRRSLRRS